MVRRYRQEYSIKTTPAEDISLLENTLNSMSLAGWDLYSIYETEQNSKAVYNCIFSRELENTKEEMQEDMLAFRSQVEKMMYPKEEPYELCVNLQKKIIDKKNKIEKIKKFLENSKDSERDFLNEEVKKEIDELNILKKDMKEILAPSKMAVLLGEEKLSISLSSEVYSICNLQNEKNLLSQTVKVRQELTKKLGYIIPKVQFIENSSLEEYEFTINIHGVAVANGFVYPDCLAFFEDELKIEKTIKHAHKTKDNLTKRKLIWIKKEDCRDFWVQGIEASEYIANYLSYYAIVHVDEIFDYNDLNRYTDLVMEENDALVDDILGDFLSPSELKYLLIQLLREKVSVKNIVFIFEKLNDFSDNPDKSDLLEKLRVFLSRQISDSISSKNKEIFAYELDNSTVELLEKQTNKEENNIKINLSKFSKFKKILKKAKNDILDQNAVLVVPQQYRQTIFILVSQLFMDVPVVCYEEIDPDYKLKIIGKI